MYYILPDWYLLLFLSLDFSLFYLGIPVLPFATLGTTSIALFKETLIYRRYNYCNADSYHKLNITIASITTATYTINHISVLLKKITNNQ